jgi:hypothetical protein
MMRHNVVVCFWKTAPLSVRQIGNGSLKTFLKNFKKTLDKTMPMCYTETPAPHGAGS